MKTQFYEWGAVPEKYKKLILGRMGKEWYASQRYTGPLVQIGPQKADYHLPGAVLIRLNQCHDRTVTLIIEDRSVTLWYHLVGITL